MPINIRHYFRYEDYSMINDNLTQVHIPEVVSLTEKGDYTFWELEED